MDDAKKLSPAIAGDSPHQRQGCAATYRINGAVYVAAVETLRKHGSFLTADVRGFVMSAERSVDIDSPIDLQIAETILRNRAVPQLEIGGRAIGPGQRCFIIAEAGVNHNGDLELARRLVDVAADAGADAVKFQTWITEKICKPAAQKADYQDRTCPGDDDQFAMLKRIELPYAWHPELKARAEQRGLVFLSTPDEFESAKFLCGLGVPALKVGSAEVTNLPHLEQLARLGKPLIVSTGMATLEEVARAVDVIRGATSQPLALLHCVSAYPAPEEEMNLGAIASLRQAFGVPVGLSDHTTGTTAAAMGVALGMCILEKHLTLDRNMPGPDHAASSDPAEFAALVRMVRKAEAMLGSGEKRTMPSEASTRQAVVRNLFYAAPLTAGQRVEPQHFEALRCGQPGLPVSAAAGLAGRVLRRAVTAGQPVAETDFQ